MLDFNLYLITDRTQTAGRELPAVVAEALAGGVRCVQLREKDLCGGELYQLAKTLRLLTRAHHSRLVINDRLDIALAVEADGVHLGSASLPVSVARRILGPHALIGYSAHSPAEAERAAEDGASFVTFGPVYHTPSKACYGAPLGTKELTQVANTLAIPVFALGGIKPDTLADTMKSGCHGVALISAIISDEQPKNAAQKILAILNGTRNHAGTA